MKYMREGQKTVQAYTHTHTQVVLNTPPWGLPEGGGLHG